MNKNHKIKLWEQLPQATDLSITEKIKRVQVRLKYLRTGGNLQEEWLKFLNEECQYSYNHFMLSVCPQGSTQGPQGVSNRRQAGIDDR